MKPLGGFSKQPLLALTLLLISGSLKADSSTELPTTAPGYINASRNTSIIGQHTTEQPIKVHVPNDAPTLMPPPRLTTNELLNPLISESISLSDKSSAPNEIGQGSVNNGPISSMNSNVEPSIKAYNTDSGIPVPGSKFYVSTSEGGEVMGEVLTSQLIRRDVNLEDKRYLAPAALGTANSLVVTNSTEGSDTTNTTQQNLNSKDDKLNREFEEYKEAEAKDPLRPCTLTANQDLLNSTVNYRPYADNTGEGYEFKYYAPQESFRHEVGVLKNVVSGDPVLEVRGYYVWYLYKTESLFPLRYTYVTHYVANELGFQVEGEHIPGSQGRVPNKLPFDKVPCSDEDDRQGAPGLSIQEAFLSGGGR